jgi:hypothetical protein
MENNAATALFDMLATKDLDPELLDSSGKPVTNPSDAEIFSFDWQTKNQNYGTVVVLLGNEQDLEIYYGDNIGKNMEPEDKKQWFDFLSQMKNFAMRNLLQFNLNNINRLKYTMQGMAAIKEGLFESFRGKGRVSYNAGPQQTRLLIKHNRDLAEGEARYRAIESIFVENEQGERFRVPSRSLTHGRILERHVAEGGTPYDAFGTHINNMMQEIATLSRFIRVSKDRDIDDQARDLVTEAIKHYHDLKAKARRMISRRGYHEEREQFDPARIDTHEGTVEHIREMFIERNLDSRIESALPILARLGQPSYMPEADEFETWAQSITDRTQKLPNTPEQVETLRELMSAPLPVGADATNANEQLYGLLGDEELYDALTDLADRDANADARPLILAWLQQSGFDTGELDIEDNQDEVGEDLDTDGVMMTRPSNMSSESIEKDLQRIRALLA